MVMEMGAMPVDVAPGAVATDRHPGSTPLGPPRATEHLDERARLASAAGLPSSAPFLAACLARSAARHDHLCPRQVLGVRAGLHAAEVLGLSLPRRDKRLLALVETDGCFADGVTAATGCALGHRTMRLVDLGKVALTLADTITGRAVRVWPHPRARARAGASVPDAPSRWHAQLAAYQTMPARALLIAREVVVTLDLAALVSRPGLRVICVACGEEIMNGREVTLGDRAICRACAGERYYLAGAEAPLGGRAALPFPPHPSPRPGDG